MGIVKSVGSNLFCATEGARSVETKTGEEVPILPPGSRVPPSHVLKSHVNNLPGTEEDE
jgi:hypothetical protein